MLKRPRRLEAPTSASIRGTEDQDVANQKATDPSSHHRIITPSQPDLTPADKIEAQLMTAMPEWLTEPQEGQGRQDRRRRVLSLRSRSLGMLGIFLYVTPQDAPRGFVAIGAWSLLLHEVIITGASSRSSARTFDPHGRRDPHIAELIRSNEQSSLRPASRRPAPRASGRSSRMNSSINADVEPHAADFGLHAALRGGAVIFSGNPCCTILRCPFDRHRVGTYSSIFIASPMCFGGAWSTRGRVRTDQSRRATMRRSLRLMAAVRKRAL